MNINRLLRMAIPAVVLILLTSCGLGIFGNEGTVAGVGWTIENIDTGFWRDGFSDATAFLNLWIYFEEESIEAEDFKSLTITDPGGYSWVFDQDEEFENMFNLEYGYFGGWMRLYTTSLANGHALLLGDYVIDVVMKMGKESQYVFTLPAPGSQSTGSYTQTYTEDYPWGTTSDDIALPKRVNVTSVSVLGDTITVEFDVDDPLVYSGYLWCYDAAGDFIGMPLHDFRDYETGVVTAELGGNFFTDGTTNTLEVQNWDIDWLGSFSLSDIDNIAVVLTDGWHYHGTEYTWDTRSISAEFTVP